MQGDIIGGCVIPAGQLPAESHMIKQWSAAEAPAFNSSPHTLVPGCPGKRAHVTS